MTRMSLPIRNSCKALKQEGSSGRFFKKEGYLLKLNQT